jgi:hypothetical protein
VKIDGLTIDFSRQKGCLINDDDSRSSQGMPHRRRLLSNGLTNLLAFDTNSNLRK